MIRTYKYKLRPSKRFIAEAERWLGFCQTLYNAALQERIGAYKTEGKVVNLHAQQRQLREIRECDTEAESIHQGVQVDVLRRLDKSMTGFFRRVRTKDGKAGFPRYRSISRYCSFTFPRMRDGFRVSDDKIKFYKLGTSRIRLHRSIEGKIKTATVLRQADGWYVSFVCDLPQREPLTATGRAVGVDVGLENFATLSSGEQIRNPQFLRVSESDVKKAQRRVSKAKPRGHNRSRAIRLLALHHLKIQRQRLHHAHQVANRLIRQFDKIVIEDLNVKGMVRNHCLAKSISDAGWSTFTRILAYKAEEAGRELVKVNPAYTSQVCSGCGLVQKLKLSQRRYVCECGLDLHRDHNAAINILASASPVGRIA